MSLRFASEQLADLRHDAQILVDCAGHQESQLEDFVATAGQHVRHVEAAVSHAAGNLNVDEVHHRHGRFHAGARWDRSDAVNQRGRSDARCAGHSLHGQSFVR